MKIPKWAVRTAVCVLVLALALTGWPRPVIALTNEEERAMAKQIISAIRKKVRMIDDPTVNAYVTGIGQKILNSLGPQPFEYHFYIIQSPVVNAFALPAGNIFIHSEVITAMKSEAQLAAIIAHEISHVTERHLAERIASSRKITIAMLAGMLAGLLVGGPAGSAAAMGSVGAGVQAQLNNSRDDEREADFKGLEFMVKAGYDPRAMAESFQNMLALSFHLPSNIPNYLTTHPGLTERVATVENTVAGNKEYAKVRNQGDLKKFTAIQDRVLTVLDDTERARSSFQARLERNPQNASAHYGLALIYMRDQNLEMAVREFQTALRLEPANALYQTDYGEALMLRKDFKGATAQFDQALKSDSKLPKALYLKARTLDEAGDPTGAINYYEQALAQNSDYAEAHYQLGVLYGQRQDMARAHLHSGRYFQIREDQEKARYHAEKALAASASAPSDIRAQIDRLVDETKKIEKKKDEEEQPQQPPQRPDSDRRQDRRVPWPRPPRLGIGAADRGFGPGF